MSTTTTTTFGSLGGEEHLAKPTTQPLGARRGLECRSGFLLHGSVHIRCSQANLLEPLRSCLELLRLCLDPRRSCRDPRNELWERLDEGRNNY